MWGEIRGKRAGKTQGGVRGCERVTYLWLQRKTYFSPKKNKDSKVEMLWFKLGLL